MSSASPPPHASSGQSRTYLTSETCCAAARAPPEDRLGALGRHGPHLRGPDDEALRHDAGRSPRVPAHRVRHPAERWKLCAVCRIRRKCVRTGHRPRRVPGQQACSPRTRGWTHRLVSTRWENSLLPAHAGMDPPARWWSAGTCPAPRARGDGPWVKCAYRAWIACSPRTRGWTPGRTLVALDELLLPAHAGMDPPSRTPASGSRTAPRARGDGPDWSVHQMVRVYCSPRTRGWTQVGELEAVHVELLPAHAGMDPPRRPPCTPGRAAPRARGDGPRPVDPTTGRTNCSPRTRGWTLVVLDGAAAGRLLPAQSGMDPRPRPAGWR